MPHAPPWACVHNLIATSSLSAARGLAVASSLGAINSLDAASILGAFSSLDAASSSTSLSMASGQWAVNGLSASRCSLLPMCCQQPLHQQMLMEHQRLVSIWWPMSC